MLWSEMTTDAIWVWWSSHTSCMFVRSGCGEKNKYPSKAPFLGLRDIVTRFLMETRHGARRKAQPTVRGTLGITKLVGRLPPYSDIWNDGATSKLTHGFTQAGKPMKFQPDFFNKNENLWQKAAPRNREVCVLVVGHYIVLLPIDRRRKKKKKPPKQTKWGGGGYFILSSDIPPAMMASLALWGFSFPFDPKINNELPGWPSSGLRDTLLGWGKPNFVFQPMHWVLGFNI